MCACGYSKIGYEPCVWEGGYIPNTVTGHHHKKCINCQYVIYHEYYYNGRLYDNSQTVAEKCYNESRKAINCKNGGTCRTCGHSYTPLGHRLRVKKDTNAIYCMTCSKTFGTYSQEVSIGQTEPLKYTVTSTINIPSGVDIAHHWGIASETPGIQLDEKNEQYTESINEDYTEIKLISKGSLNKSCKISGIAYVETDLYVDDKYCEFRADERLIDIKAEQQSPVITNIQVSVEEWTTSKPIVISGTENYCDTISVEIKDDKDEIIYSGKTNVNRKSWTISCIPKLEIGEEVKKFTVVVTDSCENSTSQTFNISKVDGRPPTVTSSEKVTDSEWSKEKTFTFTAEDLGIGNVEIGFNDVNDYSLATKDGTNYSKEYKFVGDAYSPVQASVYFKDGLGNITTQLVTLEKIDNTAPTITNAVLNNSTVSITSHDRHSTLGEGSGVVKYRYITSTEKLENSEITENNSQEIDKNTELKIPNINEVKYIYVVAEDLVGNVSESYEIEVPKITLTNTVSEEGSNGKGSVTLDWTGYDITNKYFVIYRKQEGEEEWETIVGPEEKLNSSTYIDNLGNDKAEPNTPKTRIEKDIESNQIKITPTSSDNGSNYTYYVESYDVNTDTLIAKSNIK